MGNRKWKRSSASYAATMLVALFALACSGEKEPTRAPEGAAPNELALQNATVLIGAGDIAICGSSADEKTGKLVDSLIVADSVAGIPTVVATFGDNAYPSGSGGVKNDFSRCFAPSWGSKRILRLLHPSPGNHDYDSGSGAPYFAYFGGIAGPSGKGYYSFDAGSWHVVSLNSELYYERGDPREARAQEDWLKQDLAANSAPCTMAYFHRPLFSSGVYGTTERMRELWKILYAAKADLILNGHEHHYERFAPQDPFARADSVNGIEEIIVGTGGGVLRDFRSTAANSEVRIHGRFGVIKVWLGDGQYTHAFVEPTGRVWDPGAGKCH